MADPSLLRSTPITIPDHIYTKGFTDFLTFIDIPIDQGWSESVPGGSKSGCGSASFHGTLNTAREGTVLPITLEVLSGYQIRKRRNEAGV